MVKDLKGILSMVSLDVYQNINYSSYSKEHIICLIFESFLDFSRTSKCDYVKPGFISKSDYLKYQCFGSNWLRKWESVYPNGFVPDNDHKFSILRQFENHSLFHVSEISFSKCNA